MLSIADVVFSNAQPFEHTATHVYVLLSGCMSTCTVICIPSVALVGGRCWW